MVEAQAGVVRLRLGHWIRDPSYNRRVEEKVWIVASGILIRLDLEEECGISDWVESLVEVRTNLWVMAGR